MSVMRSSLLGSLLQVLKFNLDRKAERVRVFELGRVFLRDAAVPTTDSTVRASTSRCAWPAWPRAMPMASRWDGKAQRADFFDVKGDVEALLAPLRAQLRAGRASGPASRPLRARVLLDGRDDRRGGRTAPALAPELGAARRRRCCSNSTSKPSTARRCRSSQPVPKHQAVERDIAVIVAEAVTHAALMQAIHAAPDAAACCAMPCCSTSTGRKPARSGAGAGGTAKKAWRCA